MQAFLRKHDHSQHSVAVTSRLRHYLNREGHEIHREDTVQQTTSWELIYHVLCANFDQSIGKFYKTPEPQQGEGIAEYDFGNMVKGIKDLGDRVEVEYENRGGKKETGKADLVVGADGPSSTMRKILLPNVKREYVGYVAWRGVVPEKGLSPAAQEAFIEKFTFFHSDGIQILAYVVPGRNGSLEAGERMVNWVWYCNYAPDSDEYRDLMTDRNGHTHHFTLPVGLMKPEILQAQHRLAEETLPPQFAEIVCREEKPFVQAITDVISPRNSFFDGKVLLIGDAVAGFRPHTAASTSQAAFDALKLEELMRGEIDRDRWERETTEYATSMQRRGVQLGERSQFGRHALA